MDKNYFKDYYKLERSHWWFLGRLEIIEDTLVKHVLPLKTENLKILNIGVATGATSILLKKYGEVTSVEYDKECCHFLRESLNMEVINASMTELPLEENYYDIVCAFDVIEHIEDDNLAMKEALRVLKPEGKVYITVPMHMSLWSDHDIINHHFRRYSSLELDSVISKAGFRKTYATFFNSFLYIPIALVRLISKNNSKDKNAKPKSDFNGVNTNKIINYLLLQVLRLEKTILSLGIKFGFGVSKMIIGFKPK